MSRAFQGMLAGLALAFAGYFGGFGAFLLVAALGAVGYAVGHWLDDGGHIDDLPQVFERMRR
ncbi:hypothetical protein [Streptomyces sp. VRA16 Mangrove soil]|uniref:hypothetical protein n=1 Tax=Streptomyces sp. VRA16 Mangrove soil TaxID=2817434 RepID=UPI001A9DBF5B|nr:hypothetical protein [Streptomyces sp. VRA16 Mangrove soil]MBO1337953.1 hypothetical protein [Streptomyces sp. VRA16 Mangrove soil]